MASLLKALIHKLWHSSNAAGELPIREELYSIDRLEQYAVALATEHKLAGKPRRLNLLLPRLEEKLLEIAQRQPDELLQALSSRLGKRKVIGRAFVVQLTQRLREQDPAVMPVFEWLEKHLTRQGVTIEEVVHEEHRRQAAAQVTVGNIITSMRLLSTLDWKDFFETVSLIDPELAKDPAGIYARMDFATRDRYRHAIERISKGAKKTELEIARAALQLAEAERAANEDPSHAHVGYSLVGTGVAR